MPGIALEQARRGVQQEQRQEAVGFRKVKRPFQGPPGGSRVAERVPGHRLEQKRLSQPARPVHGSGAVQDRRERGGRRGRLVQGEPQRRRGNPHLPAFPVLFFQAGEGRTGWPDRGAFGDLARAEEQVTFDEAGARTPATLRTWVVLVDGAEHQLDLIRAEAAGRAATIHVVIDIIHVLEYLWKPAWSLHAAGDPAAEDWVAVKALAVLAGGSGRAAAAITAEAAAAGLTGSQRAGADTCVRYLSSKHELLRYDQALQAGCPIATGIIEGACRHLIADRLDIGGARWGLDGAEAVLTLRAAISNGDFGEYWRFHLTREHQRLHPAPRKASTHSAPDRPTSLQTSCTQRRSRSLRRGMPPWRGG